MAERGGFERPAPGSQHRSDSSSSELSVQAYTHGDTQSPGVACPELARVVAAWEKLPEHIQKTILTLVGAHEAH